MTNSSKSSVSFCTKHTIDIMRSVGQTPTLTELNKAIVSEAKYHHNWLAAASLFEDFDKIVWERLFRLLNREQISGVKKKIQVDNIGYELSLKQIWEKTPTALQPLSSTELKLIRCVYQIMVRYAPSLKEANYYYLHLLNNHLDTPIYDEECINHCLNSLIYLISTSKNADYLEIGLELVEIALARGIGKDPTGILKSVSKNILTYHGLKIGGDDSLEKVLFVKKRMNRKSTSSRRKNKNKRKKGEKRNPINGNKNFDKKAQNPKLNEDNDNESIDDNFEDEHLLGSEEVATFLSGDIYSDDFSEQEENVDESDSDEELKSEFAFDIDKFEFT